MKKYQIVIGSPVDYEELVAYIVIDGKDVALLNQDDGPDKLRIEFLHESKVGGIDYETFIEALQEAKKELLR